MLSNYLGFFGLITFPYLVVAQCPSICQDFATGLDNCKNIDSTGVDGSGPINDQGIACVCGPLNVNNLQGCYDCGQPAALVQAWTIACVTYNENGAEAGIACFEAQEQNATDTSQCALPNSSPSPSSIIVPVSSTVGSGGGGGSGSTTTPVAGPKQTMSTSGSSSSHSAKRGPPDWDMMKRGFEVSFAFAIVVIVQGIF